MPKKSLSEATLKKLKEHSKDHGGVKHMNAMKRLMEEPPYPSMSKAHKMVMDKSKKKKPQSTKQSRAEKAQTTQDRLDESEGKKKGMTKTKGQKKVMKNKY